MILFTVAETDEQSLNKGAKAIHHWANNCNGILAAVRSHRSCGKKCDDQCHLWAVCKPKQCKTCKLNGNEQCNLCGGVIGSMKGRGDCVGIYEALQLFEHFGTNVVTLAKIKELFISSVTNVSSCLFEKLISVLPVESAPHSSEPVEIAIDSKVGQASLGMFSPKEKSWIRFFDVNVEYRATPLLALTNVLAESLPQAVQARLRSIEVGEAEARYVLAWDKTMRSHETLKVLANAMNKMMQHQRLSTELCGAYELDPCNNYHVMALRELIRTAYDIECGAMDKTKEYPNVTVSVENRQVQKEGCSPGLEKGTWLGEGRAFRSLENTGISIATLYHF